MLKISRPKSLFGKKPYYKEWGNIVLALDNINIGTYWLRPEITGYPFEEIIQRKPIQVRRMKALKAYRKAESLLSSII